jgi:hypothetical protein
MRYAEIAGERGVTMYLRPANRKALLKQWIPSLIVRCPLQLAAERLAGARRGAGC